MARIAGVNVPDNKHTEIALTAIFGIGRVTAQKICVAVGIKSSMKLKDLNDSDVEKLSKFMWRFKNIADIRLSKPILFSEYTDMV